LIDKAFKNIEVFNLRLDPGETTDISRKEFKRLRPIIERAKLIQRQILIREN
jgi:hypothetical protein